MNFHDIVNDFQAAAAHQVKKDKSSWLMKDSFEFSFADEDIESDKSKEKAMSQKNKKKKSKTDKKLTEDVNFSTEWEHISKKAASSSRNHLDNSRSRSQIFKKWQYHAYDDFHLYKKCYYLFSFLAHEDWISRAEIKKIVKKALNKDEDFVKKIRKL